LFALINDVSLARVLAKCLVGLYNDTIECMLSAERVPSVGTSEECRSDLPVDEKLAKESYTV
jgi:hypothetical protein